MPIDDCQLEITFPFKNPTADSNSYRNSAISPRFRAKVKTPSPNPMTSFFLVAGFLKIEAKKKRWWMLVSQQADCHGRALWCIPYKSRKT